MKRLPFITIHLWVVLIGSFSFVTLLRAGSFYVSTTGNDSSPGSLNSPWRTIEYAMRHTSPGDTIFVRAGTYTDYEIWIRQSYGWGGASGKYKTIKAYPGEKPVLQSHNGIVIYASWIRIEGLTFPNGVGISSSRAEGADHIEIVKNHFLGRFSYGAVELTGDDCLIEDNTIEITDQENTRDHGIYLHWGKNNIVRKNYISGPRGYGIHLYDEHKSDDPPDFVKLYSNVLIEGNIVTGSKERSGIILAVGDKTKIDGVTIRNNVVFNNNFNGIDIDYGSAETITNIKIYNNTLFGNRQGINLVNGSNITIKNNIIDCSEDHCLINCQWYRRFHVFQERNVQNVVLENNLYFPQSIGFQGAIDKKPLYGNPMFMNSQKQDFHLKAGSPAIDTGIDVGLPYAGKAPDLGAFEYGVITSEPEEPTEQPENFILHQNYPNPFNPTTKIVFDLSAPAKVKLKIYELQGEEVKTLMNEEKTPDSYEVTWTGKNDRGQDLASGIYLYKLDVSPKGSNKTISQMKKMILLH